VIVGAFIIVYLPNRLIGVEFLGINMGDLKYLFFGMALVVLMIFRPQGMFPARQQLLAYGKAAREMLRRAPEKEAAA
jgi:branched-chain amino acid transport system permease protein